MYKCGKWHIIASGGDVTDSSKYSVSTNPSGQYYILQILNVGVSDVKKYKCEAVINGDVQSFYLQLNLIGRCNYTLGIFKVEDRENCLIWWVYNAGSWDNVACDDVNINDDKYSTSKNPPTGLY